MISDKWEQVKRLYEAALEYPPDERARFLDENCGDEELRREVESLLSFSDNAGSFLEKEAVGEVAEIIAVRNEKLTSGQSLSHYKIIEPIGAGGMGEVYLAKDTNLNRKVAVKFLSSELVLDSKHLQRFVREARAASALNHPNICTIYEISSAGEVPFMTMEYVEGETLDRKIKSCKLDLPAALEIAVQIADALSEAHAHGIIHRDIKPSNIIINRRSQAKILDFGLAKKVAAESGAETQQLVSQEGMILGTAAYMSPEQAKGKEVDARSDIFSFGIVLYEMLTGRRAFAGENALDVIGAILHTEPLPLKRILPEIPPEIERIVGKTLKKDRAERYQTAKDLLADLKEFKEELSFRAKLERAAPTNQGTEAETKIIRAAVTAENQTNSIAVLPFANMSADEENEYFCDGLAEELSNALAKIEDLRVAARTSAFSFRGKNSNVSEIGKTLNVKTVLEGSVRKSGDRLRITVQLVNASDGYHLWSERYDREMRDIFEVQDEIAMAVVDALKLKLLGEEKAGVLKRYTDNPEAYQLFLKGRYHWYKHTAENVRKSRAYFEQAIELDPAYAPGYAGLGEYYGFSAAVGLMPPEEGWRKAEALLTKARELDDTLPEVHNGLAAINIFYYRDWDRAEREVRRVIELNQNFAEVHNLYSIYLAGVGRLDDAITETRRALELDPFAANYHRYIGNWLYYARRYEEAIREYLEAIELGAHNAPLYEDLGNAYEQNLMTGEAVAAWRQAMTLGGEDELAAVLDESYAKGDFRGAVEAVARKKLALLGERRENGTYVTANEFARLHARLGDKEQALEWLEKAFNERNWSALLINVDPVYDSLRSDPRYRDFLRRSGLPFDENSKEQSVGKPGEARAVPSSAAATGGGENSVDAVKISAPADKPKIKRSRLMIALLCLAALAAGFFAYRSLTPDGRQIESIAVMPFVNESGDSEAEYLSDGMTETLINNLSQLPNLSVKARSSVFHYKGKAVSPQTVGAELSVQAVLNGRIIQRGDNLTLSLELVDARTGNQIWGEQYSRRQSDLVSLQTEIARDVSQKLKIKLSGADIERLPKNYTDNSEAYQLYLRGRYHVLKATRSELQKGISYFEQAIGIDPAYALAYAGLADAYRALPIAGELAPNEYMPKAKAAAQKAIEIDDRLADAHAILGFVIFWYDWDWNAAENQFKRALELEPNNADAHLFYAHLLSNTGRSAEALAEAKRARELDPLNLRTSALEAQFLIHAGQTDEALVRLQKTLELNQNHWLPHLHLASAYIKKESFAEAVMEARRARELNSFSNTPVVFLAYALAKSGRQAEARRVLNELLKLSKKQYVSPYNIAAIYNGLDERDQTLIWLERGIEQRDPRITFLKVEPKWKNLRGDPRYQDLLRRMGLPH